MVCAHPAQNLFVLSQPIFYSFVLSMMDGVEILDSECHPRLWLLTPQAVQCSD